MNKTVAHKKQYINDNTIESLSLRGAVAQSFNQDLIKSGFGDAKEQILGKTNYEQNRLQKTSGDLTEGQELILSGSKIHQETNEELDKSLNIEPGINYTEQILQGDRIIMRKDTKQIEGKMEDILVELKRLTDASEELKVEFREVSIEQRMVNPGKYHLNFFEWILSTIRLARMKIEDSGAWLSAFQNKKSKRQYWAMFKKHGTTFGLSNERVVATQTG